MTMPEDIEDDCQEGFLQFSPNGAGVTKSELAMEVQEPAYKITQLEVLVKENTNTLTEGFNQLFTLMNEFLQDHSKQPYCSEFDEAKGQRRSSQSMVGYDPLYPEFLESPIVNLCLTCRKYSKFNQSLSRIFKML